jgi:hypothetical protein
VATGGGAAGTSAADGERPRGAEPASGSTGRTRNSAASVPKRQTPLRPRASMSSARRCPTARHPAVSTEVAPTSAANGARSFAVHSGISGSTETGRLTTRMLPGWYIRPATSAMP